MTQISRDVKNRTGQVVRLNSGGSNVLARQIVEGARVDVFVSADEGQMDVVERAGRVVPGSRVRLLSNTLAVIVSRDAAALTAPFPGALATKGIGRVAIGQPESVPAGVYTRQWLESVGLWAAVRPKVVPLPTVRAALAAVREGRADAGVVYGTDARTTPDVVVVHRVPEAEAPPIVYPAAAIAGGSEADARRFIDDLFGAEARAVFEGAGFGVMTRR